MASKITEENVILKFKIQVFDRTTGNVKRMKHIDSQTCRMSVIIQMLWLVTMVTGLFQQWTHPMESGE